jgi:hypothetical protein
MEDLKGGSKKGDLGPMYGAMFEDYLKDYSHWGWFSFNSFFGDLSPLIKDLKTFDVVTYPNAVGVMCMLTDLCMYACVYHACRYLYVFISLCMYLNVRLFIRTCTQSLL